MLTRLCLGVLLLTLPAAAQATAGSVRGVVLDADFDAPLPNVQVTIVETGQRVLTTEQGNYVVREVAPGSYTVLFVKEGYERQVRTGVVVAAGRLTDVDVSMFGDFTEMEEFVVQDVLAGGTGTEAALLQLRLESPSFLDSVSADLMSRAGASDAAGALRLVAGASVQDGKFAVVRGLPDRYVNSQMNRVRLPTADEEKRAVQLDQFPSAAIESVQVSKTFTPDQQGDASGGAVNIVLKGIPDETKFSASAQYGFNPNVSNRNDFLSYDGGGVSFWGNNDRDRDVQFTISSLDAPTVFSGAFDPFAGNWDGAVAASETSSPIDFKWGLSSGIKKRLDNGWTAGAFGSFFYERDSSLINDGIEDNLIVETPGDGLIPAENGTNDEYTTSLFDYRQGRQSVQWGFLGTAGIENDRNSYAFTYLTTRIAEDTARVSIDTRGKELYSQDNFGIPYDVNDINHPAHSESQPGINGSPRDQAPYVRLDSLNYTERTTDTYQLDGRHTLPFTGQLGSSFRFFEPELDWNVAWSRADLDQPDKRLFAATWKPIYFKPGIVFPPIPSSIEPAEWEGLRPADNFSLGNLQRIFKKIEETSLQGSVNLTFPFEQWNGNEGFVRTGVFADRVDREFFQDTYSNVRLPGFGNPLATDYDGDFFNDPPWAAIFPFDGPTAGENPAVAQPLFNDLFETDVPYDGETDITAAYLMSDMPINDELSLVGGLRFERTEITIDISPEADAQWYPAIDPSSGLPNNGAINLAQDEAFVDSLFPFTQNDLLPALAAVWAPTAALKFRAAYSETVARQTFRELSPVLQQEFLGAPVFIGNPELEMSEVQNYDLRFDYAPSTGSLVSFSLFRKEITDPIEFRQRTNTFTFTEPVNYPEGTLDGIEIEVRQDLGRHFRAADGLQTGLNATFLEGIVQLPADEIAALSAPNIQAPRTERDMTGAPEYLWNLFVTYDAPTGTRLGLFYTLQGDTLAKGGGENNNDFIPDIYQLDVGTLNFSIAQRLGKYITVSAQAKNLTDPDIVEVYRSEFIGADVQQSSFSRGIDYSIKVSAEFRF